MKHKCPISAQLVIPASFAECLTYEKQILWLKNEIDSLSGGGDPDAIAELQRRVTTLESYYNELQRQINNLPIETIENEIAVISADIQLIKNSLNTKQDVLTFDDVPMPDSQNPVRSAGILEAIHNEGMRVEQLVNSKVDESTFNAAIQNIVDNYDTSEDVNKKLTSYATKTELSDYVKSETLSDYATKQELGTYATKEELGTYATKQELGTYATKEELAGYVTEDELGTYVTEDDLANYTTNEELSQAVSGLATKEELNGKQNTLQFDVIPTSGSQNPVTSDGIYNALQSSTSVVTDDLVTENSENPVKSSGIYQFVQDKVYGLVPEEALDDYATKTDIEDMATKTELNGYVSDEELTQVTSTLATKEELNGKQNTLQFDSTPTEGSQNPVTSDGIKKAIDSVITEPITVDSTVSQSSENPVSSNGIYNFVLDQMGDLVTTEQLATKQDTLTFDQTPTSGSGNVVTSNGIYTAIQTATQDTVKTPQLAEYATKAEITDMATNTSVDSKLSNYATKAEIADMATNTSVDSKLSNYATKNELSDYATKEELMDYATHDDVAGVEQQLSNYATNAAVSQALANKQDTLVFDNVPTVDSQNPVRSSGIYNAINTATTDMLTKTEANDIFLNKSETTQFIQRKECILNNNIIKDWTSITFGTYGTSLGLNDGNLSLSKVFVEYDRDVYNENGMWVLDCNLIVLFTTNEGFELPSASVRVSIDRTTTNQNKQMILKTKECSLEIFGISNVGPKYCVYYPKGNVVNTAEDYTNEYYFADLEDLYGVGVFTLLSNNTHYIKVKCPYKLVSSTQFTVDTSFI